GPSAPGRAPPSRRSPRAARRARARRPTGWRRGAARRGRRGGGRGRSPDHARPPPSASPARARSPRCTRSLRRRPWSMIPERAEGMSRTVARRRLAIKMQVGVLGALLALAALAGPAAAQVPPDQDWRTITTERARVTFPVHLEPLARRAAHRAEVALDELAEAFIEPPEGPIDIVLTDHTDFSNGFAQVTPSNRITIFARPPADELGLGYLDDWLELVLTHEIAHVVHLDHTASGLGRLLRAVFGRVPGRWPFFPGFGTPRWLIEGLATWFESDLTASGRLQGTFHEMQLRTAVIEDRFEGIDQASALSPVWPAGNRSYAYGSLFFDHLMARHGEDSMADFAEAVAGQWIPYRMNAAGRSAFGQSLSDAWREWGDSLG